MKWTSGETHCTGLAVLILPPAREKTCQPCWHLASDRGGGLSFVSPPPNLSALLNLPSACRDPSPTGFLWDPPRSTWPGLQTPSSLSPLGYRLTGPWLPPTPQNCSSPPPTPSSDPLPLALGRPTQSPAIADASAAFSPHHASRACWLLKVIHLNHSSGKYREGQATWTLPLSSWVILSNSLS